MQASVIVSYYKNIPNLKLILAALDRQTKKEKFEVILSEDDDSIETVNFLNAVKPSLSFPIIQISQQDKGFRKCRILNKALQMASADFIIFIDGDCIPHKKFIEAYLKEKKEATVLYGRRVMLSERLSKQLLATGNLKKLNIVNMLLNDCKRIEEGLYMPFINAHLKKKSNARLLGCNMGIFKKDLIAINGFDEDYESAGVGEDTDIEWRLEALGGIVFQSMKFKAFVYHLYHPVHILKDEAWPNQQLVDQKKEAAFFFCKNGLNKMV